MGVTFWSGFRKIIRNLPGWRTNRKIIVFESDDWGSVRMPSADAFTRLENAGLDLRSRDAERYNLYDTLATSTDLEELFNVLTSFKDANGNNPVFTAVSVVANPDFEKIKNSGFNEYFYEPFTETLKRYKNCEISFELWKKGIESRIFIPQFHGREHLNVSTWLRALKSSDRNTRLAFEEKMWGFVPDPNSLPGVYFQPAFLPYNPFEIELHKEIIIEGLNLFEKLFGYRAEYFVPPNGPFNNSLNKTLFDHGIKYRSASKMQNEPFGNGKTRRVLHWMGQKDKSGITYITRNCFFEPSQPGRDWVDSCLNDIKIAFQWNKPAIISTHRVNYIGALCPKNRDRGLGQLSILIKEIFKRWPEAEIITTPELGEIMRASDAHFINK